MMRLHVLALTLAVTLAATFANSVKAGRDGTDINGAVRQLVSDIRRVTIQAKSGAVLEELRKDVLDFQTAASDVIQDLPGEVSARDVELAIKMATAGAGNHEILTALLADDVPRVLNGRLTLSLAFLERAAQLLNDELKLTNDVSPQLAAIVFGANVTLNVIDTADQQLTKPGALRNRGRKHVQGSARVRRDTWDDFEDDGYSRGSYFDAGWSRDGGRWEWRSSSGRVRVRVGRDENGFGFGFSIGY